MALHPIQIEILDILRLHPEGLRYSRMKPAQEIENDLYNYHLQQLVKLGRLAKNGDRYLLTSSGKELLMEQHPIDHKFKVASLCLVLRAGDNGKEVLYQTRGRQPFKGHREIIGGGIRRGEKAVEAAARRITEEAGLTADFALFGIIRKMRSNEAGALYSDIIYHVCVATEHGGELSVRNEFGEHSWIPLNEAGVIESHAPYGSGCFSKILEDLQVKRPSEIPFFYFEETYAHDIY